MFVSRVSLAMVVVALACTAGLTMTYRVDATLPNGGDCPLFGAWDAATSTCRIDDALIEAQDLLRIEFAVVEVNGTLTNEGLLDNRGRLVVNGFLNSTNDLVNFWDGTLVNRGQFFSHFMYNFGRLTNESTGTIEFELHLENNAPLVNAGHLDIVGNLINIPQQTIENLGSMTIAPTGSVTNSGRMLHVGQIDNSGVLINEADWIEHCESGFAGNPIEGVTPTAAQSLYVGRTSLEWCAIPGALGYDVVEGDLGLLGLTGGDFSEATTGCLANDLAALSFEQDTEPRPGQGRWFLVRGNGVAGADFDSAFSSQIASRNDGIAASIGACP